MKQCPFCGEEIQDEAVKCKHCKEWIKSSLQEKSAKESQFPPELPKKPLHVSEERTNPTPRPWVRYWARILDMILLGIPSGVLTGLLIGFLFPVFFTRGGFLIIGFFALPATFVMEAFILSIFGNTPAKAILKTKITNKN